ncbi:MAG TPA: DUF4781 domain-containing protein, partial [Rhizobacter sp.]|nr:DUF4781 domain-containing protein [Rhizobacter sp.]
QGHEYKTLDDYRANNSLPIGDDVKLVTPLDGNYSLDANGNVKLFVGEAHTETGWQTFRRTTHFDAIVGGVGFVAGVVLTVGSLGTLSVPGALMMGASISLMAAGAYGVVTSIDGLSNQAEHGVSINPLTNGEARMEWLNLGLSAVSIPVAGTSARALLLASRANAAMKAAEGAEGMVALSHVNDAERLGAQAVAWGKPGELLAKPLAGGSVWAMGEGTHTLIENWDHMTPGQRWEQIGMMGMNVAGFASPIFAKGYVQVHESVRTQINAFRGVQEPQTVSAPVARATGDAELVMVAAGDEAQFFAKYGDGSMELLGTRLPDGRVMLTGGTHVVDVEPVAATTVPGLAAGSHDPHLDFKPGNYDVPDITPHFDTPQQSDVLTVTQVADVVAAQQASASPEVAATETASASRPRAGRRGSDAARNEAPTAHDRLRNPHALDRGVDPLTRFRQEFPVADDHVAHLRVGDLPDTRFQRLGQEPELTTVRGPADEVAAAPQSGRYDTTAAAVGEHGIAGFQFSERRGFTYEQALERGVSDIHLHPTTPDRQGYNNLSDPRHQDVVEFLRGLGPGTKVLFQQISQALNKGCCPTQPYYLHLGLSPVEGLSAFPVELLPGGRVRVRQDYVFEGRDNTPAIIRKGTYLAPELGWEGVRPVDFPTTGKREVMVNYVADATAPLEGSARMRDLIDHFAAIFRQTPPELAQRVYLGITSVSPRVAGGAGELTNVMAYMTQAHPDVKFQIAGLGEINFFNKEAVESLVTLSREHGPHTLENADSFLHMMNKDLPGSMVVVHMDVGRPTEMMVGGHHMLFHGEVEYRNHQTMIDMANRYPQVNFVWAHAGGLSRSGSPGKYPPGGG